MLDEAREAPRAVARLLSADVLMKIPRKVEERSLQIYFW
jgi:hypothetical protein